jgi:RNA-directed DNA polymerase
MTGTPRPETVSTKRQRIAELARNCPDMAFTNLAHHIDIAWMYTAYAATRKDGAVGVDGQTAEDYEVNLNGCNRARANDYATFEALFFPVVP